MIGIGIVPAVYVQLGSKYPKAGMVAIISMTVVALSTELNTVPGESLLLRPWAFITDRLRYRNGEFPKEAHCVLDRRRRCTHSAGHHITRESSNQTGRLPSCLSTSDYRDGEMRCLGHREWTQS